MGDYAKYGLLIAFSVVVLQAVLYLIKLFECREREALAKLTSGFDGFISDSDGNVFNGNYAGIPFRIDLHRMEVIYRKPFPFPLEISKEHYLSRLGKSLGIPRDIQTWNPAFDFKFIISSPKATGPMVLNYFKSPDKKDAVQNLFALGVQVLKTKDDGLAAESFGGPWCLGPDALEYLLRNMEALYRND